MKPVYLYEIGIKPWEQTKSVGNSRYATVTIVQKSIDEIFSLWLEVVLGIMVRLPVCMKWRSVGHSVSSLKVQELKLVKRFKSDLSSGDVFERNADSGIYSYVLNASNRIAEFDLNEITHSKYTVLVFAENFDGVLEEVWRCFKFADAGLAAEELSVIFECHKNLVVCRVSEADTHVAVQFIGAADLIDNVLLTLNRLNIDRVDDREVVFYISGH